MASTIVNALIFCISAIILYLFQIWWTNLRKLYLLAAKFENAPGYSYYPLIGHAHHYNNYEVIVSLARSFTKPVGVMYLGLKPVFYLNEPTLLEDCMTNDKCINHPNAFDIMKQAEHCVYLAKDNEWKQKRKLLNHGFKPSILNFYTDKFIKHDQGLIQQLEKKVGGVFDIIEYSTKTNYNKFFDCAFGLDLDRKRDEYLEALLKTFYIVQSNLYSVRRIKFVNDMIGNGEEFNKSMSVITKLTKEIIADRLKIIDKKTKDAQIQGDEYEEVMFIDYILENIKAGKYDEKDLITELIGFTFASIDTCANTFSFLCLCLAMHPEIQKKVYEEIIEITGDRPFHYTDYQRLAYLQMVIKETMRLFPAGAILHRQTSAEVKIGEYIFPKDTLLILNVINVHRSSKYYPNPTKFDPERFAPNADAAKNRHRFAYLPFSGGRRNCIGERFAMLSLMSAVVAVVKQFRLETTLKNIDEIRLETQFATNSVEGYPLQIYHRN